LCCKWYCISLFSAGYYTHCIPEATNQITMEFRKINHRTILTSIALLVIPIALVAILFPILPIIQVPALV